jgi:parallel beta-helix repeat protein
MKGTQMKFIHAEHHLENRSEYYQTWPPESMCAVRQFMIFTLFLSVFVSSSSNAQPSGGPYGPLKQTYESPKATGKIYYVSPDGQAAESGEQLNKPTSLEAAIERVSTGDAIVLRGGTYRTGNLLLNQGITIQPYKEEQPVLKGTLVAKEWRNLGNGLWSTSWSRLFPAKPADWWGRTRWKNTPLYRFNNDMVFVDGRFLQAVGREGEVDENTYFIDYEAGQVYIGIDPASRLVEITAYNAALIRTTGECHGKTTDHKGPVIRGITFTQYAFRAIEVEGTEPEGLSAESKHGKEVVETILEHCTISFCSRVAAFLRGDKLVMRHCKVSDTSTEGVYLIASNDVLLEKNIFTRNNIENIEGYYPAAVKIFNQCYRVTCRDNLVIDLPNSNGIWYDVGNVDGVFINNRVQDVGRLDRAFDNNRLWPSDNGFFFEISKGAICAGNVFVNCDHGILVLNSSGVRIYNNTLVNSMACIGRTNRTPAGDSMFGWHSGTGPDVPQREGHVFVNNLLYGDEQYNRPLLAVWQPAPLCEQLKQPQLKQIDYNIYVRRSAVTDPLLLWSPAANEDCQQFCGSLVDLRQLHTGFEAHGLEFTGYIGQLFKSSDLGSYELLAVFPGAKTAAPVPEEIGKLLSRKPKDMRYSGAYPPLP